jgi:hypothetical protein
MPSTFVFCAFQCVPIQWTILFRVLGAGFGVAADPDVFVTRPFHKIDPQCMRR